MNTASQDLAHHLEVLRQKLEHPTDYELALSYFLEEFAGDAGFMGQSQPEAALHLMAALTRVASHALGRSVTLQDTRAFGLPAHHFYHGNAAAASRVLLFFYFESVDTGLAALIPGVRGGTEVARFRLTGPAARDPKHN